ncbi:MAG: co-chaperone GroES [Labilithrix sp.]|nr:co-chaperone GroES [Labilithrix sp.]
MSNEHANETIIPLHEWALVQPENATEEKSAGGIILSRDAKKHPRLRARVLAVGPGEVKDGVRVRTEARPGDVVLLQRHNLLQGLVYHDDENGPCLIPQSEIIAIVRSSSPRAADAGPAADAADDDPMTPSVANLHGRLDERVYASTLRAELDRLEARQDALLLKAGHGPTGGA